MAVLRPLVSEVVQQLFASRQLPAAEQAAFLLKLVDLATEHVVARVKALQFLQQFSPTPTNELGDPVLESWAQDMTTKWLVHNGTWDPVTLCAIPDGSGLYVVIGDELKKAIEGLMQTAAPVEGMADGQLVIGFCSPEIVPGSNLYLGLFSGPFGPYLEAFVYPWPEGEVPVSSKPLAGTLDVPLELEGLLGKDPAGTLQLRVVAAVPPAQSGS